MAMFSAKRHALQAGLNAQAAAVAEAGTAYEAEWRDLQEATQELDAKLAANRMMVERSGLVHDVLRLNVGGRAMRVSLPALTALKKSSMTT